MKILTKSGKVFDTEKKYYAARDYDKKLFHVTSYDSTSGIFTGVYDDGNKLLFCAENVGGAIMEWNPAPEWSEWKDYTPGMSCSCDNVVIKYRTKGRVTEVCVGTEYGEAHGIATCLDGDTFNVRTGVRVAYLHAMIGLEKEKIKCCNTAISDFAAELELFRKAE